MAASLPTQGNRFHSSLRSISPTSGVNVADNDGEGGVFALYGPEMVGAARRRLLDDALLGLWTGHYGESLRHDI